MFWKNRRYKAGIDRANAIIDSATSKYGKERGKQMIAEMHEQFDARMFEGIERGDDVSYFQGLAMGLGMYAITGKKLKE